MVFTITNTDRAHTATAIEFSDNLAAAIPGMTFTNLLFNDCGGSVGGVGTTRELRIRGTDSFSLGQRPVIYIDGIRVDNRGGEWGSGTGGSPRGGDSSAAPMARTPAAERSPARATIPNRRRLISSPPS